MISGHIGPYISSANKKSYVTCPVLFGQFAIGVHIYTIAWHEDTLAPCSLIRCDDKSAEKTRKIRNMLPARGLVDFLTGAQNAMP